MQGITALVVGTDGWAINHAAGALRSGDVAVLRCHDPGEPAFPCNAFKPGRVCPLDAGFDVVLTVRARPSRATEPDEVGVICALRTNHPLVVAGVIADNPFGALAAAVVPEGGDAARACRDVVNGATAGAASLPTSAPEPVVDLRSARR